MAREVAAPNRSPTEPVAGPNRSPAEPVAGPNRSPAEPVAGPNPWSAEPVAGPNPWSAEPVADRTRGRRTNRWPGGAKPGTARRSGHAAAPRTVRRTVRVAGSWSRTPGADAVRTHVGRVGASSLAGRTTLHPTCAV